MGLLLIGLGVVAIVLIVGTIKTEVFALWFSSVPIIVAIMILSSGVGGTLRPPDYNYMANIRGVGSIDFKDYSEDGQVVTIKGYAVEGSTHWLDFKRYTVYNKTLIVQVPDGKVFDYSVINTPVQKVITTEVNP